MTTTVRSRTARSVLVPAALLALAAGCSSGSGKPATAESSPPAATGSPAPAATTPATESTATVSTGTATVSGASKTVLVAPDGKTLYYFVPDGASGMPTCTGGCAGIWPALTVAAPTAGSGVTGKLAVVMGGNGDQVTYNGHPLYEYSKDTAAGQANGEGIMGKWHVATADLAAGAAQPSSSSTSSSGGYGSGYGNG